MSNIHLVITILAVGVLSYGFTVSYAQINNPCTDHNDVMIDGKCVSAEDELNKVPSNIIMSTDKTVYRNGDTITLTGTVNDPDSTTKGAITIIVTTSDGTPAKLAQTLPDYTGDFTTSFNASGSKWTESGKYQIKVQYGGDTSIIAFVYDNSVSSDDVSPPQDNNSNKQTQVPETNPKSSETKSTETSPKSTETKPKPSETKSTETKSTETKPKSSETKSTETKPESTPTLKSTETSPKSTETKPESTPTLKSTETSPKSTETKPESTPKPSETKPVQERKIICGEGTKQVGGICQLVKSGDSESKINTSKKKSIHTNSQSYIPNDFGFLNWLFSRLN